MPGKGNGKLPGGEVDASAGDGLWLVAHEAVGPQAIVHEIPRHLNKLLVRLETEELHVHDDQLVWVLYVDAKTKVFEHPALSLDHIVLCPYVVAIQDYWFDWFSLADLLDVGEHVDDVPHPPGRLRFLYLTGKTNTTHGDHFHGVCYKGFGIEEALEEDTAGGHCHLGKS